MERNNQDLGYQHNVTIDELVVAYRKKETSGEGWNFDRKDNDMPFRDDLSNPKFNVCYRSDDEAFIVIRNDWAIDIHPEELPRPIPVE
jgi:hypothetical protein